ncbi:NUDIX domain-containing protein, partial [Cylindrospermopsis raciborskii]|uniref:NUDIX domain-containing protein n=1 Tax=Cylindrospermopsis raciborskii TaxID=77022 RepID=UPI0022BBF787
EPDVNHAVKALIYRNDGSMLLQQRDSNPDLPLPNTWTWFGGLVELGEELENALERELIEELGCLPGKVEEELFRWEWTGEEPALNHIFSLPFQVKESDLTLMEGQSMGWFYLSEIFELSLTPLVFENLSKVAKFLELRGIPEVA